MKLQFTVRVLVQFNDTNNVVIKKEKKMTMKNKTEKKLKESSKTVETGVDWSMKTMMDLFATTETIPPKEYPYEEQLYSIVHSHMWHESILETHMLTLRCMLKNESIETRYMMSKVMIDLLLEK